MPRRFRQGFSVFMTVLTGLTLLLVMVPLFSIVYTAASRGAPALTSIDFLTQSPADPCSPRAGVVCHYGGIAPAIEGSLALLALAALIAVPVGLAAAIYVVEYGADRPVGRLISATADVMSGIPSIVAGLVVYSYMVANDPVIVYSTISGSLALSILMLPIVTRTAEEALRTVPHAQREAAMALGISKWKASMRIVVVAALPGIVTGILLSVARAAGEAAPLLLTAFGNNQGFQGYSSPAGAMPLLIFDLGTSPYANWQALAWATALVLLLLVLLLSVASRLALRRMSRRLRGEV